MKCAKCYSLHVFICLEKPVCPFTYGLISCCHCPCTDEETEDQRSPYFSQLLAEPGLDIAPFCAGLCLCSWFDVYPTTALVSRNSKTRLSYLCLCSLYFSSWKLCSSMCTVLISLLFCYYNELSKIRWLIKKRVFFSSLFWRLKVQTAHP